MLILPFPGTADAPVSEVGGKARSLIATSAAGFNVPAGFVLTTEFFLPWLSQIKESELWRALEAASGESSSAWQALRDSCMSLEFAADRKQELFTSFDMLAARDRQTFQVAVRSSAPEEDLEGASFAGGYLSVMGVTGQTLEDAIRRAFASCLDYRVCVYKKMRGFDPMDPKIAVVVQRQIASEISGVGFSLNPLTNDFDEIVINSNWGLGETVVSGLCTPDKFVLSKDDFSVVESEVGSKDVSMWLGENGEVNSKQLHRANESTLNDAQLKLLGSLIAKVEDHFGRPMDIEWCIKNDELFLLQARPITAFAPVPPDMATPKGLRRKLYLDVTISVQGISKPLSVMGADTIRHCGLTLVRGILGDEFAEFVFNNFVRIECGKIYSRLSTFLGLFGKEKVATIVNIMDTAASATIRNIDEAKYADPPLEIPSGVKTAFAFNVPRLLPKICGLLINPEKGHLRSQEAFRSYMDEMRDLPDSQASIRQFWDIVVLQTIRVVTKYSIPLFMASRVAQGMINKMFPKEPLTEPLYIALPNNPTVQMGLDLSKLALLLPAGTPFEQLKKGLNDKSLPAEFLTGWHEYLHRYGHRGPLELDLASPRYIDNPDLLLSQVCGLASAPDPSIRQGKARAEREAAYETLLARTRGFKRFCFKRLYKAMVTLGGYREAHKYFIAMGLMLLRRRIVKEAEKLCAAGRLESPQQVFDLTVDEFMSVLGGPQLDLPGIARLNRELPDKLAAVADLSQVFDSRGRMLRPPAPELKPGELAGSPISAGVARGPVKVLHTPDEKPFLPGDILVARATDPGWTPLFASAAAVVLEVGGMLQHGALVAREYGLPCVAGVSRATSILEDNTIVEVDGTSGIVRIINEVPAGE